MKEWFRVYLISVSRDLAAFVSHFMIGRCKKVLTETTCAIKTEEDDKDKVDEQCKGKGELAERKQNH